MILHDQRCVIAYKEQVQIGQIEIHDMICNNNCIKANILRLISNFPHHALFQNNVLW